MRKFVALGCLLSLALPLISFSQEQQGPPNVVVIYREDVKPGRNIAHQKSEAAWTQAIARAKWPQHFLAMTTTSGPNQAWFGYGYESLEAYEKDQAAQAKSAAIKAANGQFMPVDGELVSDVRTMVGRLVPELSFHPMPIGEIRFFRVRTVRVRIGHAPEYIELVKTINSAMDKSGFTGSSVTFSLVAGAPLSTFLVFSGAKSMADFDKPFNLQQTLGSDYDHFMSLVDKSIISISDDYLQVDPQMSYPDASWVKADPNFWTPKTAMAKASIGDGSNKVAATPAKKKDTTKGQ